LDKLAESGLGCFMGLKCLNSFMYADDLILLSISISDLQKMLDICNKGFHDLDLPINIKKSCCLRVGPRWNANCKKTYP